MNLARDEKAACCCRILKLRRVETSSSGEASVKGRKEGQGRIWRESDCVLVSAAKIRIGKSVPGEGAHSGQ